MCLQNLKFVALPVPETIAIEALSGGLRISNLGEEAVVGVGDDTVRKS